MLDEIKKLINRNKWKDVFKFYIKNKIKFDKEIVNGNNIVHLAAINNLHSIINYVIKKSPDIFLIGNMYGNTPIHIMAIYGYYDLLKLCLQKNSKFANLVNNSNKTILHLLKNSPETILWIIKNIKNINYDTVDGNKRTLLLYMIKKINDKEDIYYQIVKNLMKQKIDLKVPKIMPPLHYAILLNHKDIVEILLEYSKDIINYHNSDHLTPILFAVNKNNLEIAKILLDHGANINYHGPEGDKNLINISLLKGNDDMVKLLLKYKINLDKYNRNIETPLHIAFSLDRKISSEIIATLIYDGNMNIQNIKGDMPLHFFMKKYNWKNYNIFLSRKDLDIFKKNSNDKDPLYYLDTSEISTFMDFLAKSFLSKLKKEDIKNYGLERCYDDKDINNKLCIESIKKYIMKHKSPYPTKDNRNKILKKINHIDGIDTNYGKFNSNILHNMIYTVLMLDKYSQLSIPYQHYIYDKVITEKSNISWLSMNNLSSRILNIYTEVFYELVPYLILWKNKNEYYLDKHLNIYIQNALKDSKIRFIFLKLTIISSHNSTHANILLFDKQKKILERFEPYGVIPYLDNGELDEYIKKHFKKIFNKFTYLGPKDTMNNISFQIISNDANDNVKKLGDPLGYCLAWTYWYIELRLKNPDIKPNILIKKAIDKIRNGKANKNIFIDFIRNYANKLDQMKNKLLLKAGLKKNQIYDMILTDRERKMVIKKLVSILNKKIGIKNI